MFKLDTLPATAADTPALDFSSLREQGVALLQRLAGQTWTDHNAHDPGITMLEQLCYALTDLAYRIDYDIEDLLASGGDDAYRCLYRPDEILSSDAVTLADLRRLALDVEGVRNAWLEPVTPSKDESVYENDGEQGGGAERLHLKGLYRVLIALADPASGRDESKPKEPKEIVQAVARRLHAQRNLCEDFHSVEIVEPQPVTVSARIAIRPVENADAVLARIGRIIADYISPPVRFASLEELIKQGLSFDEIFEGPLLAQGFLTAEALAAAPRRAEIHTSDLIREIMSLEAVRTVLSIRVNGEAWVLELDTDGETYKAPTLDLNKSSIELTRDDITVAGPSIPGFEHSALEQGKPASASLPSAIMPPRGRDRNVGRYRSILHQFPACYGVGEAGLPLFASPQRRAEAKQLKAYLMFFDQLLANGFAQLANVAALFSFAPSTGQVPRHRTCFSQVVGAQDGDTARLGLDEIRVGDEGDDEDVKALKHEIQLQSITEDSFREPGQGTVEDPRRNRFLDHLLARVGEQLTDYALVERGLAGSGNGESINEKTKNPADKIIDDKQAFLRNYPRISAARGSGANCLTPFGTNNCSGLEQRIRRKLGLLADERFCVVEHILLRPVIEDAQQDMPLLEATGGADPYSLQVSFVFPGKTGRFHDPKFQAFVEHTVVEETPAHLMIRRHWLEPAAWDIFEEHYKDWFDKRGRYLKQALGITYDNGEEA